MKVIKLPENGTNFVDYEISGKSIDFGDGEMSFRVDKKERDYEVTIDICQDSAFRLFGAHSASFAPFDCFHLAGDFARRVFGRERIIAYRVFLINETRFIRKSVIPLRNREKFVVAIRKFPFYLVYRADVVTRPRRSFRCVFARDASVFYRHGI